MAHLRPFAYPADSRRLSFVVASDSDVIVRRAVLGDARAMCVLSVAAITELGIPHYTDGQLAAWAARRTTASHESMVRHTAVFVAVAGGSRTDRGPLRGFASVALSPLAGLVAGEVDQLFVAPAAAGRGIARLLLAAVEEAALAARLGELVTHASWRAVPVFESCGFHRVADEAVDVDGQVLTRSLMRKRLDARHPQE
jgi:putative acetyltransferase